ncbi:dihydropyrimidinase-related protein 3 [Lepeophtheirus salmonis]|uniref:dihydropyrimidinase n=1 Tax=Lepeophtheirus salmonis TaxID=72036 RepID=A0A0K2UMP4_LEPSM|nr:dihydropyrimidinase-related protein 3-like [Lepeophtheirus salmonis]
MTPPLKKVPIHLQSAANRLLIKNGSIVNEDGVSQQDIYVEEGMIKLIGNHLIIPGGTRIIDAMGKMVLPGGIDMRVHFQSPNASTQTIDDYYRGTKAAINDGTTTVVDCVVPSEDETLIESLKKWKAWAEEKSCCDYAFKIKLNSLNESKKVEMESLVKEHGVNAFFVSMKDAEGGDAFLIDAMETCTKLGALLQVQCESRELIAFNEKKVIEKGIKGPEGYSLVHSEFTETEGTMRATTLSSQLNFPLYVANIMSPEAAKIVASKKQKGSIIFGETLTAGIGASGDEYRSKSWRHAAAHVCSPPLRCGASDDLCQGLADGSLDVIASQHSTFNYKQKALGKNDFREIPEGVNGAESRMSLLWDKCVKNGSMTPCQFVAVTSSTPAKILNLYPDKGCIAVGSDADIVIWDPEQVKINSAQTHLLKTDFNIFEGIETKGSAEFVVCGGRIMLEDGNLRVMQGYGKYLPCNPFPSIVFDKLKERESQLNLNFEPVERSVEDMNALPPKLNGIQDEDDNEEDIPGPPTPVQTHPAPVPSQHESNFNLNSHPNNPDVDVGQAPANPRAPTVRVREPPGGQSCGGFW